MHLAETYLKQEKNSKYKNLVNILAIKNAENIAITICQSHFNNSTHCRYIRVL